MVVSTDISCNMSDVNYKFIRKAGRSIIDYKPLFSPDGESLLVIVENIIRVYNIQTSDCARILETENSSENLLSIQFPENDQYNLYGCSENGTVTVWTYENGAVLRENKLSLPENHQLLTFDLIDSKECFVTSVSKEDGKNKHLHLASYSLHTGDQGYAYSRLHINHSDIISVSIGVCDGDKYAAICNGSKTVYVQNINQPHLSTLFVNQNKVRVISVTCHPCESSLAITDAIGRVTIYRGYIYDYSKVAKEVLHWHHLPALAACFTKQGNYLLSGGMEKVLVKWTIGHLAKKADEKQFIPRLPGIIRFISTNNTHIAITCSNNSIVVAQANMRVSSTILECGGISPFSRSRGAGLVAVRGGLVVGGRTGHLQLYSTTTDKVVYNIDITQMNNIPATRENLLPLDTEVTCAAVNAKGTWLVTSEYRNDGVTYPEERLKFWEMHQGSHVPFKLNTCVNLSHGGCQVVSIALNNNGNICVTSGQDEKFRIWKQEVEMEGKKRIVSWCCLTACYYSTGIAQSLSHGILNNFKNQQVKSQDVALSYMYQQRKGKDIVHKLINIHKETGLVAEDSSKLGFNELNMGGVAISQDGSLTAAWFGAKLTLWDTHLCSLRATLSHPALRPKGVQVQFGHNDAAHYLVCTTENCVAVWSLLSLTVKWMVQIKPSCLASDNHSNKMAVVTTANDLYIFTPHSSKPILVKQRLLDPAQGVIKQCTFGSAPKDEIRLYFMRNDAEIYSLEPEQTVEKRLEVVTSRNLPRSNFSALLAEQQLSDVRPHEYGAFEHLDSDGLGKTAIAQFLSSAPHMMPPVSLLCTSFLEHISGKREIQDIDELPQTNETDQESSDDEDSGPKRTQIKTELWTPNYEKVKEKRLNKITKEQTLDKSSTVKLFE